MLGSTGFDWGTYVDWMSEQAGSLAAVADRLCAYRGYKDDAGSVERALRRLRRRGSRDGGTWGARAVLVFGLPEAVDQRVRWLGQYHSRFTDLPASMAVDLLRAWSQPPTTESRTGRAWIALGHASLAIRARDHAGAAAHLARARADLAGAPPLARLETVLVRAYLATREAPATVADLLAEVPALLDEVTDPVERACLHARWIDHRGYALNQVGEPAAAEALYRSISDDGPPFARARRASGLAFARWKQGAAAEASDHARRATEHAGDGGHVRARAMALGLLARITGDPEAHARAIAISRQLEDETMLARLGVTRTRS
ncbi:MAG: hypothetical protein WKG01_03635 [Kofleriaceae bacterium]